MNDRPVYLIAALLAVSGLTAFWCFDVFAYGYAQMIAGQLLAALLALAWVRYVDGVA